MLSITEPRRTIEIQAISLPGVQDRLTHIEAYFIEVAAGILRCLTCGCICADTIIGPQAPELHIIGRGIFGMQLHPHTREPLHLTRLAFNHFHLRRGNREPEDRQTSILLQNSRMRPWLQ